MAAGVGDDLSFLQAVWNFLRAGLPSIGLQLLCGAQEYFNLLVVCTLQNESIVSGFGVGSCLAFVFTMAPIFGEHYVRETSDDVQQAHTDHLKRRWLGFVAFAPLLIFALSTRDPDYQLGWSKSMSYYAKEYVVWMLPGIFLHILNEGQWQLYGDLGNASYPVTIKLLVVLLHPMWCWLLCDQWGKDIVGVAMANALTNTLQFVALVAGTFWFRDLHNADLNTTAMF